MCGYFRVTSFFSIAKCVSSDGFFGIQILPNSITAGELTTPISPFITSLEAFGVS